MNNPKIRLRALNKITKEQIEMDALIITLAKYNINIGKFLDDYTKRIIYILNYKKNEKTNGL